MQIQLSHPPVPDLEISKAVMTHAFNEIDMEVVFKSLPAERSIQYANNNMTQGVLTRIEGIEKEYENLIRIPVPNNSIDIYPIALKSNIYIQSIEDLKKVSYWSSTRCQNHRKCSTRYRC